MTLSDAQRSILREAARHPYGLALPPQHLPPRARAAIARALLKAALLDRVQIADPDATSPWRLDGETVWLVITDAGREAADPPAADQDTNLPQKGLQHGVLASTRAGEQAATPDEAVLLPVPPITPPSPPRRPKLRDAAAALLACWDATSERAPLADAVAALRAATGQMRPSKSSPRGPRQGTKQEVVLALLRRPEGATIASVVAATGWAQHTVRGFFAHLKHKGHAVEVLERVRQVGSGHAGAKGSYSVYRLAEAG